MKRAVDLMFSSQEHLHCFAHLLNLVAQDALTGIHIINTKIEMVKVGKLNMIIKERLQTI